MSEELKVIIRAEISQLKKSIEDAKKAMGSFKEQVSKHAKDASSNIKKMGERFAEVGKKIAKAMAAAAVAVGASLVALGKKALDSYGDYEQLVGGIETLFKDSSSTIMNYANNAYKNQQISANQYMELATSFSASLLQSLGGDTAEAARVADLAITDMADNANKMGSSMESIQNAYQTSVYKGYKRDKIEMRGDRAEISDFPLYLNTVAGGLDCRDQTIGGFSFVVKIYAVPVVEIIG